MCRGGVGPPRGGLASVPPQRACVELVVPVLEGPPAVVLPVVAVRLVRLVGGSPATLGQLRQSGWGSSLVGACRAPSSRPARARRDCCPPVPRPGGDLLPEGIRAIWGPPWGRRASQAGRRRWDGRRGQDAGLRPRWPGPGIGRVRRNTSPAGNWRRRPAPRVRGAGRWSSGLAVPPAGAGCGVLAPGAGSSTAPRRASSLRPVAAAPRRWVFSQLSGILRPSVPVRVPLGPA